MLLRILRAMASAMACCLVLITFEAGSGEPLQRLTASASTIGLVALLIRGTVHHEARKLLSAVEDGFHSLDADFTAKAGFLTGGKRFVLRCRHARVRDGRVNHTRSGR